MIDDDVRCDECQIGCCPDCLKDDCACPCRACVKHSIYDTCDFCEPKRESDERSDGR